MREAISLPYKILVWFLERTRTARPYGFECRHIVYKMSMLLAANYRFSTREKIFSCCSATQFARIKWV